MDDLISRQAAIDEIKEIYEWHDNVTKERIIEHFEMLPSAQAEHGRWEVIDEAEPRRYGCSICKRLSWYETNYCSCCGADMRERKEE